jgi:hypothetical protein
MAPPERIIVFRNSHGKTVYNSISFRKEPRSPIRSPWYPLIEQGAGKSLRPQSALTSITRAQPLPATGLTIIIHSTRSGLAWTDAPRLLGGFRHLEGSQSLPHNLGLGLRLGLAPAASDSRASHGFTLRSAFRLGSHCLDGNLTHKWLRDFTAPPGSQMEFIRQNTVLRVQSC